MGCRCRSHGHHLWDGALRGDVTGHRLWDQIRISSLRHHLLGRMHVPRAPHRDALGQEGPHSSFRVDKRVISGAQGHHLWDGRWGSIVMGHHLWDVASIPGGPKVTAYGMGAAVLHCQRSPLMGRCRASRPLKSHHLWDAPEPITAKGHHLWDA